jgi:murein DD-endopeptidase MepM/ murein hydrolase activator NlpD
MNPTTKTELRLPFDSRWFVFWGGRTLAQNHHASTLDQRFAYDLVVLREGRTHVGDRKHNEDYYCFGQRIVAPALGTAVSVENGVEDNVPGVMNPKQPMGNHVILDHGNGEFSFLCHLRKGTVAVRKGDQLKAGELLGLCGNSGNSSEPHLHYHLQDSADFGWGRGLPAPFRDYLADGKPMERGEPVKGQTIEPL